MKVWECKIVVPDDVELPNGFDNPPRKAAIKAVEDAGIKVLGCSSGWGGSLTKQEEASFKDFVRNGSNQVYYAGLMDCSEDVEH